MTRACIIIPVYRENPTENEILSISRNMSILSDYDIYIVCPDSMKHDAYEKLGIENFVSFSDNYFKSNKTYSRLMLSKAFYMHFLSYEYMLIAQPDTYILNTDYTLEYFMDMGYDYFGAPWPNGPLDKPYGIKDYIKMVLAKGCQKLKVGNGGFSLRKISTCKEAVWNNQFYIRYLFMFNEDLFYSLKLRNIPTVEIASKFALETNMQEEIDKGNYPYALHAFEKHLNKNITEIENMILNKN